MLCGLESSISESFLTVKGAALFLPRGNGSSTPRISHRRNKHAGDLQQHLQAMFTLLRPEDNIRLTFFVMLVTSFLLWMNALQRNDRNLGVNFSIKAVKLESTYQNRTRYMVVVSTNGRQDTEESIVLGIDFAYNDSSACTTGLVLPLWSDTLIHLDGDGGFSVSTDNRVHIFKPVSVQAMWSALQSLHKACEVARANNYYPGSLFLTWVSYYESHINSDQSSVNEWNAMQDVQSHRSDSPVLFTDLPTERERTERLIKIRLREIMMQKDLENVTSKQIRTELEMQMVCNLREFKEFIDNEMIVILGQMDSPTEIFDHVYLGSEWNASNLEDLQNRGVRYILNVTREIDNFFPGVFEYHNIRVYDEEDTDLLAYWNDTYKFISKAKKHGAKCLVHCKMGVSRSASTVIAYAMKEYGWNLDRAFDYVKERRTVTKPNPSFMRQLEEYQGILLASKQRHNKLWRSHSDSDLSDHHEPIGKTGMDVNKKDITSSAEQLSDLHHSFSLDPQMENLNAACPTQTSLCNMSRDIEFTSIEDILNLNTMNGCAVLCCSEETEYLDNCRKDLTVNDLTPHAESLGVPADLLELTLEDMEKDALKNEVNCHLLPLEELDSDLRDLPESPDQISLTSQSEDMSTDRIDFLSALEKFVELSQENRPRAGSSTRVEDQSSGGKNGGLRSSWVETPMSETQDENQRLSSDGNTSQTSDDSSADEEQPKDLSEQNVQDHILKSHSENAISVKEIITEIESFNQGLSQCQYKTDNLSSQAHAPKRIAIQELPTESTCDLENNCRQEPTEGSNVLQHVKAKDSKCPSRESKHVSQEECDAIEGGDQQEPLDSCPKWVAGSVRRATMEFEERLRQEQEQQHAAPVPTRKNSKNDHFCDSAPKGKFEESTDNAHEDHERDKKVRLKIIEATEPLKSEPSSNSNAFQSPGMHTVQFKNEYPFSEVSAKPKGTAKEPRTLLAFHAPEMAEPTHPPKKLGTECNIGYKCSDDNDLSPCKEGGKGETIQQKENIHLCPDAPLQNVCTSVSNSPSADTDSVSLSFSLKLASPDVSFSTGRSYEENSGVITEETSSPDPATYLDFPSPDIACPPCSILIEGVTEDCTSTDKDLGNLLNCAGDFQNDLYENLGQRETGSALSLLSNEDLNLINTLKENIRELHEVLDIPSFSVGLPHSSSSDSLKDAGNSSPGVVKQRTKEIEARIRQAGLTTPSQMKRSASLAKLGCLELSKDDLSERESVSSDLQAYSDLLQSSFRIVPGHYEASSDTKLEDPPEKLCIISLQAPSVPTPTKHFVEQIKTAECIVQSKPVEKPLVQYAKEFGSVQQGYSPSSERTVSHHHLSRSVTPDPSIPLVTVSPRHEHGRTHPLRRLKKTNDKKRTTNPLYNTM